MSFIRKKFYEGKTYHETDWDELQNNIGLYYDNLLNQLQGAISGIILDYLTSAHRTELNPHPNITIDYIGQGTNFIKLTAAQAGNLNSIWNAFGASPSMDNIPQGTSYIKLSATQASHVDSLWNAFGGSPSMDNIPQGTSYKKLSAAEYSKFLTGFYDILDSSATVKFGHGRNISGFYFAKGADADGANIFANDLFLRGYPVYVLVFTSAWYHINSGDNTGPIIHSLGFRPEFAQMQTSNTDPTGQPEEYIYSDGYAGNDPTYTKNSYAAWNNLNFKLYNWSGSAYYMRVLLYACMGS